MGLPVLITGPEGSGTTLLAAIVSDMGVEVFHRSLPYAGVWWTGQDPATGEAFPEGTRTVVIVRRPDVTQLALLGRKPALAATLGEARGNWQRAMGMLARLPHAWWVNYEALVLDPEQQVRNLAAWLGVEVATIPVVRDENAKWLSVLEC